jgi:Ca2+/H+ antiporter
MQCAENKIDVASRCINDAPASLWRLILLLGENDHHQRRSSMAAALYIDVVPRASPKSGEHSEFRVTTAHAEPLRKSAHFLHQYTSPFTMLPSVLFYKEGLYISTQHHSKHWRGSPFTGSPHHHLVRVGVNTSILILIVSILLYFLQASLIAYAIWQFELK